MSLSRLRKILLPVGLALGLAACGETAEHEGPVPLGGSIVIAPSGLNITTAKGFVGCGNVVFQREILISTFDQSGLPRGNVDVDLFIDFADLGITGIGAIGQAFGSTKTDDSGNLKVIIFLDASETCVYTGSLSVTSGSIVEDMTFDVSD